MAFRYEVMVDIPLSELFRRRFLQKTKDTACCELFKLVGAESPNLWEFRRKDGVFTLTSTEVGDTKEKILIESKTGDISDVILDTLHEGATQYLLQFMSPLAKIPKKELETRIRKRLLNLEDDLQPEKAPKA